MRNFYKRRLPHWHPEGATFFITTRLSGSLPRSAIEQLEATRQLLEREEKRSGESTEEREIRHHKQVFAQMDKLLDKAESGPLWLKNPLIANLVEEALLHKYSHLYTLWAYVVMANHLHLFLRPKGKVSNDSKEIAIPFEKITKRLKGATAREANKRLQRTGKSFWEIESYDHWPRSEEEFFRIIAYIENNPVKAGLVKKPEDWQWSSAAERKRRGWSSVKPLT